MVEGEELRDEGLGVSLPPSARGTAGSLGIGMHCARGSGFRVRVQGAGYRVQGSSFRVQGSGFRVQGLGFRVQGSGCRVQGSG